MSNPFEMLIFSIIVYGMGALFSILLAKQERLAIYASGLCTTLAAGLGILAVLPVLLGTQPVVDIVLIESIPFLTCPLKLDLLAALMIAVISLLAAVTGIYSLSYVQEYIGKGASSIGFFMNIFIASMVALMVVDNAFYFIIFFEMMSLASYFLVITDQKKESIKAGLLYFFIAHAGSILIMVSFFLMFRETGNLHFESFRLAAKAGSYTPWMASLIFLLAFFGFGAKAGMLPLHSWLPLAHPAAPSHASAMMSGVMIKIGVFGIIKVGVDILGATQTWWGIVVLAFGAVTAVVGVLYALAERDIKRLLAYSSVENVGIILIGVGVGMVGMSLRTVSGSITPTGQIMASLGFLGALYHLFNHSLFKGLLFLGAGAIIFRTHTKNMDEIGGLARAMPLTATAFLVGCMAISALPPLNGFVSEWYTYQALFSMSMSQGHFMLQLVGPITVVMLAITGGFAVVCFVKAYGVTFCGPTRHQHMGQIREVPVTMLLALLFLALACVLLGVGAIYAAPIFTHIANSLVAANPQLVAVQGASLIPNTASQAEFSPALLMILLVGALALPILIYAITSAKRLSHRKNDNPWACGYDYEERMAQSSGSFIQPVRYMFAILFRIRERLSQSASWMRKFLDATIEYARKVEPMWDDLITMRVVDIVQRIGSKAQLLQHGDFRVYCLYVVVALILLLLFTVI